MKKQFLIIVNILLCVLAFSQDLMNGYDADILTGTYKGHKFDVANSKMNTSKNYKITIANDYTFSIEAEVAGSWKKLLSVKTKAISAKPNAQTQGIAYEFEVLESSNYSKLEVAIVGENRKSFYGKEVVFTLLQKTSNDEIIYVMDKEGGLLDPDEMKEIRADMAKQKKKDKKRRKRGRDELRWGAMAGAGYITSNHNFDNLNTVIGQFNNLPDVEQSIGELSNLWGAFAEADIYYKNIFVGMGLAWRQNETFGIRPNALGDSRTTYFRLEHRTFSGQLGLILHPNNWLKIALGGTIQKGKYKFLSASYRTEKDREGNIPDLFSPQDARPKHVGGFAKIFLGNFKEEDGVRARFFVEGQYMVGLNEYNLLKVNETFNPTTFMNDDNPNLNIDNSYIGLKIGLLAGLGL